MWSPVRKALGLGQAGYLGDWQAGRQYFAAVGPRARQLWVWFEPDMLPGYAWSFPLPGGMANVGYGVVRRPGQSLGELKGQRIDLMARPHIAQVLGPDAVPVGTWKAWPIPAGIGATVLSGLGGRVLFAGDAVGVRLPDVGVLRPATPPPDFDLEIALASLRKFAAVGPTRLLFSHYGPVTPVTETLDRSAEEIRVWVEETRQARAAGLGLDHAVAMVRDRTKDRYAALHPGTDPAMGERFDRLSGAATNVGGIMYWLDQAEQGSAPPGSRS